MAEALRNHETPASTLGGNRRSLKLTGDAAETRVSGDRAAVQILWVLTDADGKTLGTDQQRRDLATTDWARGSAAALAGLAESEVAVLTPLVQDTPPVAVKTARRVAVRTIAGAPGDGERSLTRAITFALQKADLEVTPDASSALIVFGRVTVEPAPQPRQQHVTISWSVLKPDGSSAGEVKQENTIPQGSLDGAWGEIALAVASAAVDGLVEVINRTPI
jgi:hypothetical protein